MNEWRIGRRTFFKGVGLAALSAAGVLWSGCLAFYQAVGVRAIQRRWHVATA